MKNKINAQKTVSVLTLGCSKNVVDSENLIGLLKSNNFNISENLNKTDILIINTCGFIKPAKEENINVILEACDLKKSGKIEKLIVAGCLSERYGEELREQIPDVDHFFGVNAFSEIIRTISTELKYNLVGERQLLTPSHYAFMKISEGCNHECSFCAIPLIRGKHISRPMEELIAEAENLGRQGVKELNLIAQDSTWYGRDLYGKKALGELLDKISDVPDIEWIRLHYAYPTAFPLDVLDVIAKKDKICKYIDIPLQHASDKMLLSMRRGINKERIEILLNKIRSTIPDVTIRSTFIVGYPGETDEDFEQLCDFLQIQQLDRVGVFTYSHEEDTHAFSLVDDVTENIKNERRNRLMEIQQEISLKKNKSKIGKVFEVLIDEKRESGYVGRTKGDAPEVDNLVMIKSYTKLKPGDIVQVKIENAKEYDLFGTVQLKS